MCIIVCSSLPFFISFFFCCLFSYWFFTSHHITSNFIYFFFVYFLCMCECLECACAFVRHTFTHAFIYSLVDSFIYTHTLAVTRKNKYIRHLHAYTYNGKHGWRWISLLFNFIFQFNNVLSVWVYTVWI